MRIYIARSGDTLLSAASRFHCDAETLRLFNGLKDPTRIAPGMALLLPDTVKAEHTAELFAFAAPDIPDKLLTDALPALSYLSTYSCRVSAGGTIRALSDGVVIEKAIDSAVMPVLTLTNTDEGGSFSSEAVHELLHDDAAQKNFYNNLFSLLALRRYRAVNIDFECICSFDREVYSNFLISTAAALHTRGYFIFTTPDSADYDGSDGLYSAAADFKIHGQCADRVILPPRADSEALIRRALGGIPSRRLLLGFDNAVDGISANVASELAAVSGACVRFDSERGLAHFTSGSRTVCYNDARSMRSRLELVRKYKLAGLALLSLESPFTQGINAFLSDCIPEKFM